MLADAVPARSRKRDPLRERFAARIPGWYRASIHLTINVASFAALAALAGVAVAEQGQFRVWTLALAPVMFVAANGLEYAAHRYPMHHRTRGLSKLFKRHTLQHHRYFTHNAMETTGSRDLFFILLPIQYGLAFVAVLGGLWAGLRAQAGADVAAVSALSLAGYFLWMEWVHLLTHLPPTWFKEGSRMRAFVAYVREHHRLHHDPRLMTTLNFNITLPLWDALLSTQTRGEEASVAPINASVAALVATRSAAAAVGPARPAVNAEAQAAVDAAPADAAHTG